MTKNIVVCCDGTGNEYGDHNTNVVGAFEKIVRDRDQIAYYDPGVGTFNFLGETVGKKVGTLMGTAFGYGLRQNLEDAYEYLMNRYQPDDKVYLLGFSRGAFTVRAFAGMIHKVGLLQKGSKNLIPYAIKTYLEGGDEEVAAGFKNAFSHECKPYYIGVWDTVGSLGYWLGRRFFDATLNSDVAYGYHAVAIDEKRKKFPVSLWDEDKKIPQQTIEQVWFAGVHSDVGGWYDERGLSDIALLWMMQRAEAAGLRLREDWRQGLDPNPLGTMHESRSGAWKIWPKVRREIPDAALIHDSVIRRMAEMSDYQAALPTNYESVT